MKMKLAHSELFKVLGVDSRIKIIELLKTRGPMGVKNLAEILGLTPAAVSQHLKILRHAGFVSKERKGYWIPYSIDEAALENCGSRLMEVCACDCHGSGTGKKSNLPYDDLEALEEYKKELEKELAHIQKKISQMRARKK